MAIGDFTSSSNQNNGNNQNSNKVYEPNYYSRLKIKNSEDKLVLSAKFSQGLLYLDISEISDNFKTDQVELICLSPTKAFLLASEIKNFINYISNTDDIDICKAFGVNGGMGEKVSYIGFHATKDKEILITIGKFDNEGRIIQSHTMHLNKDYNYSLQWSDIDNNRISKNYNNMVEITQILYLLEDFARCMNGAFGYSTLDLNRYEASKNNNNFKLIFDKLGIERPQYGNRSGGNNDFLTNSSRVESNHTTIEGIEGLFD